MSMSRTIKRFNGYWFTERANERYAAIVVNCLVMAHLGGKLPRFQRTKGHYIIEVYPEEGSIVSSWLTKRAIRACKAVAGL